jgi:predicted CxxxxCH...CXXCH cytochrome family protein
MTGTPKSGRARPFVYLLLIGALFAAGCSTGADNSGLALVDERGDHPAGFVATHGALALPDDGSKCRSCHGDDLRGGISGVSCSTASFDGQACHAGGPTPANHQPIATWVNAHQGEAAALRPTFSGCNTTLCHGATLQGGVGPSCFSASYSGFLFHPAGWYLSDAGDHRAFVAANGTATCSLAACHGATLHADPPDATGPSCFRATWGALACHAGGPGTGGGPTVEGAHNEHLALGTIVGGTNVIDCATCHSAPGGPPEVSFITPFPYTSQIGGPSTFDNTALTCLNVSCHGGQANVDWQTGTLDVNTQCTSCHEVDVGQFNSPTSGEHDFHVNGEGIGCTACHNTTTLAVAHFTTLSTPAMEGPASATIGGAGTQIPAGNYTAGSCTPNCHPNEQWF